MKASSQWLGITLGVVLGAAGMWVVGGSPRPVDASNDRFEDYVLCTGAAGVHARSPQDGVWLLDYRSGKLLGTIVDRSVGKTVGFAEVDLTQEFGIAPRTNVHFLMTTGTIAQGQAALYVAETTTGKFGIYTMG